MATKFTLYFGRQIQDGNRVSDIRQVDFDSFLVDTVDKQFKCYTTHEAQGRWNGINESTTVITVLVEGTLCSAEGCKASLAIRDICREYCNEFSQECVAVEMIENVGLLFL